MTIHDFLQQETRYSLLLLLKIRVPMGGRLKVNRPFPSCCAVNLIMKARLRAEFSI